MHDFDLVIRGGTIADGLGGPLFTGDIAVRQGRISAIGDAPGRGEQEIDAHGLLVTPGFVDVHTHYDGQVTWENQLSPSSQHGVTTAVMGNCGVGFAPCRPDQHDLAIRLMEGVEDIPGIVMEAGVPWNWETFPQYLDAIEKRETDIDFAAQIPHSCLRVYVMGERGADLEPPTAEDLPKMRALTAEAINAGALGVSTSRTLSHRFKNGKLAPSVGTELDELKALAGGLRDAGKGVFQMIPNLENSPDDEFKIMRELVKTSGRPLSFSLVPTQLRPDNWSSYVKNLERALGEGVEIRCQFYPRPIGILFGLSTSLHRFSLNPSYRPLEDAPLAEKVRIMRDPAFRARLIAEEPKDDNPFLLGLVQRVDRLFPLGDPPNYNPDPADNLAVRAERTGVPILELIYEALLAQDGKALLYSPAISDVAGTIERADQLIDRPYAIIGLGDGGAHYGTICDAAYPTYLLQQRLRLYPGDMAALAGTIRALTSAPAAAVGLHDRGVLRVGAKADLNFIDLDRLQLYLPEVRHDLPADGKRLVQRADGYVATFVSGEMTYSGGKATGNLPGRLVRGARPAL